MKNTILELLKQNYGKALIVLVAVPLAINFGASYLPIPSSGNGSTWIGFWGSYLGGIFTLIAVYVSVNAQKRQQKIQSEQSLIITIHNKITQRIEEASDKE